VIAFYLNFEAVKTAQILVAFFSTHRLNGGLKGKNANLNHFNGLKNHFTAKRYNQEKSKNVLAFS